MAFPDSPTDNWAKLRAYLAEPKDIRVALRAYMDDPTPETHARLNEVVGNRSLDFLVNDPDMSKAFEKAEQRERGVIMDREDEEPGADEANQDAPGLLDRAGKALDRVLPSGAVDKLASTPTPGGLFPLVIALLFFLFAIVPVHPSGATRLQLIWLTLTGRASLPETPSTVGSITQQVASAITSDPGVSQTIYGIDSTVGTVASDINSAIHSVFPWVP